MDIRKRLKNITNRKWAEYTTKQNKDYLKRQLKDFGLDIPKYLSGNRITKSNINALTKKLTREGNRQIDYNRKHGINTLPTRKPNPNSLTNLLRKVNKAERKYVESYKGSKAYERIKRNQSTSYGGGEHTIYAPVMIERFKSIKQIKETRGFTTNKEVEEYLNMRLVQLEKNEKEELENTLKEAFEKDLSDFFDISAESPDDRTKANQQLIDWYDELDVYQRKYINELLNDSNVIRIIESMIRSGATVEFAIECQIKQLVNANWCTR